LRLPSHAPATEVFERMIRIQSPFFSSRNLKKARHLAGSSDLGKLQHLAVNLHFWDVRIMVLSLSGAQDPR
jgi:hypothetical protein